jgi:hypothetical protein
MDTQRQGAVMVVDTADDSTGMTVKVIVGFVIGLVIGIFGTWLIMHNRGNTPGVEGSGATTTTTGSGVLTDASTSGSMSGNVSSDDSSLAPSGEFSVPDQKAGDTVSVSKVAFGAGGGWVVIHEDNNGALGNALGAAWFGQGSWNGTVSLLRGTVAGKTYHAVLYTDNGDKQFSLGDDHPMTSQVDGGTVEETFKAE